MGKQKIKELFGSIIEKNADVQATLADLKANKPTLADLLSSAKTREFLQKIAIFLIAIRDKYMAGAGITEEDLIEIAAEWLDEKIVLPWYLEAIDGTLFKFIMKNIMEVIENAAENKRQVAALSIDIDSGAYA